MLGGLQYVGKDTDSRYRNSVDRNNFGPRAGFALKLTNRTVLRGGYGIMYQPTMDTGFGAATFGAVGYNASTSYTSTNNGGVTYFASLSNPYPTGFVQPTGNTLGANTLLGQSIRTRRCAIPSCPYTQQFNIGVQHQIRNWVFNVTYVGSQSVHQFLNYQINQLNPIYSSPRHGTECEQKPNPFLGLINVGGIHLVDPKHGDNCCSHSHSSRASPSTILRKARRTTTRCRTRRRSVTPTACHLTASFTWSKSLSNAGVPYNYGESRSKPDHPAAERTLSPIDVASRTVFGYTYELPVGRGKALGNSMTGC